MKYEHYLQLLDQAKKHIAKRVQGLQPRGGNNVSVIGDGISIDPIARGEEEQAAPGWVYVILAVITAEGEAIDNLPQDTGLFVAGVVVPGGVANQGDFQSFSQVVNFTPGTLFRKITTTLYPSTLFPGQLGNPEEGIYRGALRITLELVGPSGVYDTFTVTATSGGETFSTEAPTDDETYLLRFLSAERL